MIQCPIIRDSISEEECACVKKEALKESKEKPKLHNKFRKVIGWKAICKSCKNNK
ncbi:MAG: DUF3795 domain-containing protein [Lachnoclostridium sp.]|jgi:hypothetical protein